MMFPIPFTYKQEEKVYIEHLGIRRWRYVLEVDLLSWNPGIGVTLQVKFKDQDWYSVHAAGFGVHLDHHWSWKESHIWYDGPHCMWDYGFLRVFRGGNMDCKKCYGER